MNKRCGNANFREEPLGADGGREVFAQHLDRDAAIVLEVAGDVHRCHSSAPDFAVDCVALRERVRESAGQRRRADRLDRGPLEEVVAGVHVGREERGDLESQLRVGATRSGDDSGAALRLVAPVPGDMAPWFASLEVVAPEDAPELTAAGSATRTR